MTAIRAMTSDDVDAVVDACEWLFEPPGYAPPRWNRAAATRRLRHLCESSTGVALVRHQHEQLVGSSTIYLDIDTIRFGQRAWMNELAVHPSFRSRGIVREKLLVATLDWARTNGATHPQLDAALARTDAHRFYERQQPTIRSSCFGWSPQ